MRRRQFLTESAKAAAGFSLLAGVCRPARLTALRSSAPARDWRARIEKLADRIPALLAETVVPGVSIALIRNTKLDWHRGFGVRDATSNAPVDAGSVFNAASMSKPVFAYAVLQLCDRGLLDLDTPL